MLTGEGDEILEEEIGAHRGVGARIDGDSAAFERGKEVGDQMGSRGIGQPRALGQELLENYGGGFALYNVYR